MHPALHSWRDELPSNFVRLLAYLCAVALLSIAAARLFESPKAIGAITPMHESKWIEIERPFPAFALSIPEAAEVAATYAIRRHADGGGRKDILELGDADGTAPYLHVEIYRPGTEIQTFADSQAEIFESAAALRPAELRRAEQDLASKFGPLTVFFFTASKGTPRQCLAYVRAFDRPAPAIVRLVLPERQRIHPAEHFGLRARSIDPAGRRQRAESGRAIRAS